MFGAFDGQLVARTRFDEVGEETKTGEKRGQDTERNLSLS